MVVQYILAARKIQKEVKVESLEVNDQVDKTPETTIENKETLIDSEKPKSETKLVDVEEYYVKYRNFSYLHCEWKTEEELFKGDKRIAAKLKRFKQKQSQQTNIFENVGSLILTIKLY